MKTRSLIVITTLIVPVLGAGCSGDATSPVAPAPQAALVDSAPPASPVGLAAAGAGRVVKLAWRPNTTDPDLAAYRIYRESFGVTRQLGEVGPDRTGWVDARPPHGSYRYAVTAVDAAGNESAWVQVGYTSLVDLPERTSDAGL
jgi:fibronectin type 3 domain-containing protein